jgi:hypothetical protein
MPESTSTLKLTAFERFQFWETRPGFPNQIVAVLDFAGRFDAGQFVDTVARVLPRHPLLRSRIKTAGQAPVAFVWADGGPHPEDGSPTATSERDSTEDLDKQIERDGLRDYLRLQPQSDDWQPQELGHVPQVQPENGPSFCLTILFNRTRSRWVMQTHHAVCDGVGGLQFIRELLQVYHWLSSEPEKPFPLRPLLMERLQKRGRLLRGSGSLTNRLTKLPMKWIGLFGASKFLWRRPVRLGGASSAAAAAPSEMACVNGRLTASQTRRLRQTAKEFGVTVNSLLLSYWLTALHRFRSQDAGSMATDRDCYRLMIPTNERSGGDVALSACNQVSMVYVDRWPSEMEHIDGLAAGIDFEMSVIRRWGLSGTFLLALNLFGWFPGLTRWYARRPKCWATSYVTNLGAIWENLRVGRSGDYAQVGELTLTEIRLLPPLRPALPAALAVHFYAGQLCLTLHHDQREISPEEANTLLQILLNRLRTQ